MTQTDTPAAGATPADAPRGFISARGITKAFGTMQALKGIDLDIRQGEFFSLLGASGCGKSTLLRIIGGFADATSGSFQIDGTDMTRVPPHKRPTNMVFQSYAIFPHLNVLKNVLYGLRAHGIKGREARDRAMEALAFVQMDGFADRNPARLSGGQRQRVALARAVACRPKVLLLDEPLSALDKRLREDMQLELKRLQRELGITFICVTHDQEEAMSMSDRIGVMQAGRIAQIDTPEGLYERPTTRDVAAFVGSMNFLELAGPRQIAGLGAFDHSGAPGTVSGTGVLALRPEWLHLSDQRPETGNAFRGRILQRSYLGERALCLVQLDGRDTPVQVSLPGLAAGLAEGTETWVGWAADRGILLPA